jgi:hypothetical protein
MKRKVFALSVVLSVCMLVISVGHLFAPTEGCTPGYWKNHLETWALLAPPYDPAYKLKDVFWEVTRTDDWWTELKEKTMLDALHFHGGKGMIGAARIFLRHAIAALLNSAADDAGLLNHFKPHQEVYDQITDYLNSITDRDTFILRAGNYENMNENPCPLNGNNNSRRGRIN